MEAQANVGHAKRGCMKWIFWKLLPKANAPPSSVKIPHWTILHVIRKDSSEDKKI